MFRLILGIAAVLVLAGSASAEVIDTITLESAESVSLNGDPANDVRFVSTTGTSPYTLGAISWDGMARPTENTGNGPQYPSWGSELRVNVTHDQSGATADLSLGSGEDFGPGPAQFTGSSLGLNGTMVNPGDSFTFAFFELFDDPQVSPDALWESISFHFDDNFVPPPEPPGPDVVRFDTTGTQTWPTQPGEPGAEFYGIEYGSGGSGPSIVNVRLEGHDFYTFWFELRIDPPGVEDLGDGGQFRANILDGVGEPTAKFSDEDPTIDPETGEQLYPDTFGTLEIEFAEGDFEPGDSLRFGVMTINDDFRLSADGGDMADLETTGPLSVTVTFDDGKKVTAPLTERTPGHDNSAFVDFNAADRLLPSDGDTDGDGDVDGDDLLNSLLGLGMRSGALPANGDVDGQGDVDDDDLALVAASLGDGITVPPEAGLAPITPAPEPRACYLLLVSLLGVYWGRRVLA
jgi:hypothetical protein